jgi:hypothetical protein
MQFSELRGSSLESATKVAGAASPSPSPPWLWLQQNPKPSTIQARPSDTQASPRLRSHECRAACSPACETSCPLRHRPPCPPISLPRQSPCPATSDDLLKLIGKAFIHSRYECKCWFTLALGWSDPTNIWLRLGE